MKKPITTKSLSLQPFITDEDNEDIVNPLLFAYVEVLSVFAVESQERKDLAYFRENTLKFLELVKSIHSFISADEALQELQKRFEHVAMNLVISDPHIANAFTHSWHILEYYSKMETTSEESNCIGFSLDKTSNN